MRKIYLSFSLLFMLLQSNAQDPTFQWAKQFDGLFTVPPENSYANVNSFLVTTDAAGNIYTTGFFNDTVDFDPGPAVYKLNTSAGLPASLYISKLTADGNFVWAKQFDVRNDKFLQQQTGFFSITVDAAGNVYTMGTFIDTLDLDPGPNNFFVYPSSLFPEEYYGFISKLDAAGNFVWAKQLNSSGINKRVNISSSSFDALENLLITGAFIGTVDFDPGPGINNLTSNGNDIGYPDGFILKLDANGNFNWVKQIKSGTANSNVTTNTLKIDATGNIVVTGNFNGTADFDPGAGIFNISASSAIGAMFVFKVDAGGNFVWAKAFDGSTSINMPMDIDASGNLYIAGSFNNPVDFDPGAGSFILTPAGDYDLFFTKLNAAGNFVWAKRIGAGGRDLIEDLSLDAAGNIYSTGNFENTVDFDPDACTTNLISSGLEDGFILKLNGAGNFIWAKQFGGADQDIGSSISINTSGAIYTVGYFLSVNVDFDFGPGVFNLSTKVNPSGSNSESNFILKMSQGIPGPPTVTINQAAAQADPTGTSPINFTVVFNEPVTGFATGDVTLSGTAGATTATVTVNCTTYNVAVSGMTANGTVIATIPAGVATNAGGTGNLASTSTDNTVTYTGIANPPPTVTINQAAAQADPTGTSPINFTVVFNATVTGFATGDVTLSGTAGATTATVTGSGTTYNVAVSGMIANGTVIATIAASVATNAVGTGNLASTSTDNTVTYTGIVNPPPTTGFKIYPNPVIKILHIDFATIPAEAIVQVYNVTGQLLNTWALPNLNNQISMAAYNAGIYFVRVKEGDTVIATEKIVKQ